MACVGDEGEAAGQDAADHLGDHVGGDHRQGNGQPAPAYAAQLGGVVVAGVSMPVMVVPRVVGMAVIVVIMSGVVFVAVIIMVVAGMFVMPMIIVAVVIMTMPVVIVVVVLFFRHLVHPGAEDDIESGAGCPHCALARLTGEGHGGVIQMWGAGF